MKFKKAWIKSLKADIAKGEIVVSFTVDLKAIELVETLRPFTGEDATAVTIEILPHQRPLWDEMVSNGQIESVTLSSSNGQSVTMANPVGGSA